MCVAFSSRVYVSATSTWPFPVFLPGAADITALQYRGAIAQVFRLRLSRATFLQLVARITAKRTVSRVFRQFDEPRCDVCHVRPASKCAAQEEESFAAWLYTHKRLPKAGEGEWNYVRPSCVEIKIVDVAASTPA